MIESFFEIIHSPKRTKEYLTDIISLVLFSICMFLYLSDALKFSYGFKELFHIKELLFTGILLFAINMLLVKNNNGIIKDALNSFYKKATIKEISDKIATIDLSLSKELKMSGKSFIMEESKSLFFKTSKLVTENHDVVATEKEYVSSDYNPATNTETITYRERDRILSSSNSSYYALNIDGNRIKRLGVLSMDFKNEETLKYFNIIDNITGKIHQDKIVEKNGVFSYVSSINGNAETKNDLLKVFKIPFSIFQYSDFNYFIFCILLL